MFLLLFLVASAFAQTTITTINESDSLRSSRTTINNNFASLNTNKTESKTLLRDIRDYGAACDGTTDDSAAWTAAISAINSAGGGTLRLTCFSNVGTTGISIPRTVAAIRIVGNSVFSAKIIYSGTGAAITIGDSGGFTYNHSVEDVQIDITGAGVNAVGIDIYPSLYVSILRPYITSANAHSVGSNNQIAIRATGGDSGNSRFGAYLTVRDPRLQGKFKKGIYMTAAESGWGFNSCLIQGGAIVYSGSPQTGYIGLHMEQGNQNLVSLVDVENFETGIKSEAYDNVWVAARTEANTTGVVLAASGGSTTGGTYNRVIGGSHGDGITNSNPANSAVFATVTNVGMENHLVGFNYLNNQLDIGGNYAITWTAAAGGSSGLFWKDGGGSAVAGVYFNGASIINLVNGVDVFTINNTNVTIGSNLLFPAAESKDIGTDGANRPNNVYVAGNVKSTHLIGGGASPTITSGFGTTPSIAGKDGAGRVTVGTSPAATGTITFGTAWATAPVCTAQNETTGEAQKAVATTTTLVVTQISGSYTAADVVAFSCQGY